MPSFSPARLEALQRFDTPKNREFIRFLITGVANTLIYYIVYLVLLTFLPYLVAHIAGWVAGTLFSFWCNCVFTFKVKPTWRRLLAFPAAPLANLVLSTIGSIVLIELLGVPKTIGTLIAGILATPVSFLMARTILTSSKHPEDKPESGA